MKVVYVAGPFRAPNSWELERNIRRAEELALEVWRAGFACICPHTNTRFYQGAAPDEVWLDGDLEILRRCDAVLLTQNWQQSSGTRAEVADATLNKIPVFNNLNTLINFFHNAKENKASKNSSNAKVKRVNKRQPKAAPRRRRSNSHHRANAV